MVILGCDGDITQDQVGNPTCTGDWLSVSASELATHANTMTSEDFATVAGFFVLWFVLAFGVKTIRRIFNV